MKGNWRMRVRIMKKGEIRTWQNAKSEGQLMNLDFIDAKGTKMQGTLFKELVSVHENTFQ